MARASLVLREKLIDEAGNILELALWQVPMSDQYPEGVRYRLAYVEYDNETPSVLYDNHSPKGHHRHIRGVEHPYEFRGVERLVSDFRSDVDQVKGSR